jgi:hypothetical protein
MYETCFLNLKEEQRMRLLRTAFKHNGGEIAGYGEHSIDMLFVTCSFYRSLLGLLNQEGSDGQTTVAFIRQCVRHDERIGMEFWDELIAYFRQYDTDHIENDASNNISIVVCVFVAA